jgi:hypothetical protein
MLSVGVATVSCRAVSPLLHTTVLPAASQRSEVCLLARQSRS